MLSSKANFFKTRYQNKLLNRRQKDVDVCKNDEFLKPYEQNSATRSHKQKANAELKWLFHEYSVILLLRF